MAAAQSLARWLRGNADGAPLVVNTPGWVKVTTMSSDMHDAHTDPSASSEQQVTSCPQACMMLIQTLLRLLSSRKSCSV